MSKAAPSIPLSPFHNISASRCYAPNAHARDPRWLGCFDSNVDNLIARLEQLGQGGAA